MAVRATLVAQAWCLNTGAGYTLYGLCTGCFKGDPGTTVDFSKQVPAIDGAGRPAFESPIQMMLSFTGAGAAPEVARLAFLSR